ncbi:MAG: hypothetical protein R2809_01885 [Flavobacteriales bacterium]
MTVLLPYLELLQLSWMMYLIREVFIYLMIINFVSIIMYTNRRLFWGALMFVIYFTMSVDGYFQIGIFT